MNACQGRLIRIILLCVLITIAFSQLSLADNLKDKLRIPDEGNIQILTLKDGTTLVGKIIAVTETSITFSSKIGESTIDIDRISDIKEDAEDSMKYGKYWFPNPNRTRLYFGPTGRMLKQGEGYFSDVLLFFPSVTYGVTDNISLSAGMSIFPTDDFGEQLIYFTPKIGFDVNENFSVATTALIVIVPDWFEDDDGINLEDYVPMPETVGILFFNGTYGNDDHNITGGLGFGYADDEISDNPAIQLGGEYRFSRRASFVTESWLFPEVDDPIITYGVRFFGEKLAVDLALFNILNDDAFFPGLPYIDFVYNF